MIQNEECQELLMQDVVRIDIVPTTSVNIGTPFNVPNQSEVSVVLSNNDTEITDAGLYAVSLLSMDMLGGELADAEMKEGLSYRIEEKRELGGIVRTHTLSIPIECGFQTIRDKEKAIQDVYVVLKTNDDTRYLVYALPNTGVFAIDDQKGASTQMNVKVTVQSMSGLVRISTQE